MRAMNAILPLSIEGLSYRAGDSLLLRDVTAVLPKGRRTVILGPNGAGKSLLLRLCHGLLRPTAGGLTWNVVLGERDLRRRQAMVFQRPLPLRRSALANVEYPLALAGVGRAERRRRARLALDHFGLLDLAARPARLLSGGEQQRLALARAWVMAPELLFLDEPTSALDPAATHAVEKAVRDFHQAGTTIVMSTHDLAQARRIAEDVLFMFQGRMLEHDNAERFFAQPATPEARAFLAGELVW
ncbi:MAG TPA: ATP-binding cassette domain-containing protein [Rhodospirillaceae bacterium]|nr:ATP-binding cassette domain-containing protein [Rhodospirillaceae bacterium]